MPGRVVLLVSTPRVAPGLLTREAWSSLEGAYAVWSRPDEPQALAVAEAGIDVGTAPHDDPAALARALVAATADGDVVWVGSSDGDPGLSDAVAVEVTRLPEPPEVELLIASFDVPGARLLDVVAVMDRLRSPGGCPWDAEQTHESLVPYLLEEAHEAVEAIESGDPDHVQEELGDLLLQVAFHARVAEEHPSAPFGIDDVAGGLVDKLVRRHPHVFAEVEADSAEQVAANWDAIKAGEKQHRTHPLDGIPTALPALARADKTVGRLSKAGLAAVVDEVAAGDGIGSRLLAIVLAARADGLDAEGELRATLRELHERASS
ncbi:nucleoside triphosphate pyrophosphohydrolase [Terrabacter aeriphilus]|uniref:Nucleoside triphosphate pyrophosphohydrolase n=1 Tax=Terrabacter aeriphilus TaxID=515662 RepID=A0ABP9J7X7_9MICO